MDVISNSKSSLELQSLFLVVTTLLHRSGKLRNVTCLQDLACKLEASFKFGGSVGIDLVDEEIRVLTKVREVSQRCRWWNIP